MKRILLRVDAKHSSKDVFKLVAENSPQKQISVSDMRKRVKLLEALENSSSETLVVEDAEWQMLKQALEEFPWSQASKQLLDIIDDVIDAKEVSRAELKAVEK